MSLSEKIRSGSRFKYWFHEKDVKEFISELKNWIPKGAEMINVEMFLDKIDKLAGPDLI